MVACNKCRHFQFNWYDWFMGSHILQFRHCIHRSCFLDRLRVNPRTGTYIRPSRIMDYTFKNNEGCCEHFKEK